MILFLRDAEKISKSSDEDESNDRDFNTDNPGRWKSANPMGSELEYSTAWIHEGKVACFMQLMNPGPSLLYLTSQTEAQLKTSASEVIATQNNLNAALSLPDPVKRAESLAPFVQEEIALAQNRAFRDFWIVFQSGRNVYHPIG